MAEARQADSSLSAKPCPCYGLEPLMPDRPALSAPGLTMFFPAYNDAGTIARLVLHAREALRRLTPDCEIIVVNAGSRDQTAQIADELARTYPNVRVIHHAGNRGYGGALRTGFSAATKELT